MKFNSLTSTKKPKKKVKRTNNKSESKVPNVPFSLQAEISKNYEGISDNILGAINILPEAIRNFFRESELKSAKVSCSNGEYILEDKINNNYHVKIKRVKLGGKHMLYLQIKMNNRVIFKNYIKAI